MNHSNMKFLQIVSLVHFCYVDRYLATTSADQTVKLWRTSDFSLHSTLQSENQRWVWDIAFSADSQYAITGEYFIYLSTFFYHI